MKYVLTAISYPITHIAFSKVKNDVEMLVFQSQSLNVQNAFMNKKKIISSPMYFKNDQITLEKRSTLIDWIIAVHKRYKLREETLYMTIYVIDSYCSQNLVLLSKYQLLGISALFMSAKYEEI